MNKSALKKYAPQARKDFIAAVTRRAETLGLNPKSPGTVEHDGDVMLINGQPFPADLERQRSTLQRRIAEQGFAQVMDAMAYTWFNRLVAIRYMELHGFLDHGYRVLSHPANKDTGHTQPEILDHIAELDLPGLDRSRALDLKLAGNRDEELYREVLLAQCHALHKAMPFLFESLDDATELLLPDGLLRTDSILGKLVTAIDEADWQDVEIIGWLYQFYISEKKDQVIGKVVKSEDIPAATQLFTPNWIVKYLVQNSLGRLWLMANPTSQLATKWEYYIKPAEQTPEVNAQLDALITARIAEDGTTLNPESLTLLDPACGSGHILVEAYDLLRDIYLERGYRRQDIPRLILEKNLYGLDIDDRAAQLAGFALLMRARADDRRLFGQPVGLNVLALQEAKEGSTTELHSALNAPQIDYATVSQLVTTFERAKTFGSLIQIPDELARALPNLQRELKAVREGGDMLGRDASETLLRLVAQAQVLAKQFDAVVANPPYMGGKGMNAELKAWAKKTFPASKSDLFAMFIERGFGWCKPLGFNSMVTMHSWMFLSSFHEMREKFLKSHTVSSLVQLPYDGRGPTAMGISFGVSAQVVISERIRGHKANFDCLRYYELTDEGGPISFPSGNERNKQTCADDFCKIPGAPFAYWLSDSVRDVFDGSKSLGEVSDIRQGMATTDNARFLRLWHEVDYRQISFNASGNRWFPYNKGSHFQKWAGNQDYVVLYTNNGEDLIELVKSKYPRISDPEFVIKNRKYYFKASTTWSDVTSASISARYIPPGYIFDTAGPSIFEIPDMPEVPKIALCLINSSVCRALVPAINPTMHFNLENAKSLPVPDEILNDINISRCADKMIALALDDLSFSEKNWSFKRLPLIDFEGATLEGSWSSFESDLAARRARMQMLEHENNAKFIRAFRMESSIKPDVGEKELTLASPDPKSACTQLVSFAVGCMMGRYSLDAPGLIYAHAGNEEFDPTRYETFPADDDGIVPITDEAWFDDDGANRIREFVRVVWGEETEAENMAWLAESLGSKASESADDTIRRYLSRDFYKDHLQTYKKRPIYWLFSSGKHKAFEALVYLHRYNAGTLSRMRMEYVVPLQSRMQSRIDSLEQDIHAATSSAETKRLQKQRDKLTKQLDELRRYDENLRHYADQRISLDLDDGAKVNYGKFGDLLAEVKAVTGKKS